MPKLVDHDRYRKELLAQCFDLFAQSVYSALTMRQIAEALDVSTGTLYHYFPTKEALFQQLVEEVTQQTIFAASAQMRQHDTFEERLMALFRFLAEHEDDLRKQLLVTLNYYQHRDLYGKMAGRVLQAGEDRYTQAIQSAIGLADPQLCFLLQSQIQGFLMLRMLHCVKAPFIEQARPFVHMFAEYMRNATKDNQTS
ncbi:TetR/AcrR family transcriptional regulator [Ktedonospora formicarum]|uniref:TetR family transcriptional regulator n=1 Tax=Ktedonospora formicarum TaxID=2778364 RepID=A0A8J3I9X6_9CHLR|nr:TetR/AcrR family transcriptional regulator [Ktedonospora formicarum]GHO51321.1 TetR family transcriptional regulator [Ktedonospora formicarum]